MNMSTLIGDTERRTLLETQREEREHRRYRYTNAETEEIGISMPMSIQEGQKCRQQIRSKRCTKDSTADIENITPVQQMQVHQRKYSMYTNINTKRHVWIHRHQFRKKRKINTCTADTDITMPTKQMQFSDRNFSQVSRRRD